MASRSTSYVTTGRLTIVGGGRRCACGWALPAREEIVRLRRLLGSAGRPLNFTVRSRFGEIQRREELGGSFGWLCGVRTVADSVVLQASSFGATGARAALGRAQLWA